MVASPKFPSCFNIMNIITVLQREQSHSKKVTDPWVYKISNLKSLMSKTVKVFLANIYSISRCDFVSNIQCVLRQYNSTQICFLLMLEKWENSLSDKQAVNEKPFKRLLTVTTKNFYLKVYMLKDYLFDLWIWFTSTYKIANMK